MENIFFIFRVFVFYTLSVIFSITHADDSLASQYQCIEKNGQKIHVLTVDPSLYKIVAVKTNPVNSSLDTVSSIVAKSGAVAGINGGFFYVDENMVPHPAGPLKIEGKWLGRVSNPRAAIGWYDNNEHAIIDRIVTKSIATNDKPQIKVIPQLDKHEHALKKWQSVDYVVGGIPLLIKNNQGITDYQPEISTKSFLEKKHARTAVCVNKNQHWIFVVAEHTKETASPYVKKAVSGLTMPELSQFMHSLGCQDAINLDGGGSSVMVLNQRIMNDAGDMDELFHVYHERPVLNAILVFPRKTPGKAS